MNTPFGRGARTDGYFIRTAAATAGIPCVTTLPGAIALIRGLEALRRDGAEPRSLQELHALAGATRPVQGRLVVERGAEVDA